MAVKYEPRRIIFLQSNKYKLKWRLEYVEYKAVGSASTHRKSYCPFMVH